MAHHRRLQLPDHVGAVLQQRLQRGVGRHGGGIPRLDRGHDAGDRVARLGMGCLLLLLLLLLLLIIVVVVKTAFFPSRLG